MLVFKQNGLEIHLDVSLDILLGMLLESGYDIEIQVKEKESKFKSVVERGSKDGI